MEYERGAREKDCFQMGENGALPVKVAGKRVLSLGNSLDSPCCNIAKSGAEWVLGVDPSPWRVQQAKQEGKRANLRYLCLPPEELDLPPESVDLVLAHLDLCDREGFPQLMERVHRWLVRRGELFLSVERPKLSGNDLWASYVNRLLLCGFEIRHLEEVEGSGALLALAHKQDGLVM